MQVIHPDIVIENTNYGAVGVVIIKSPLNFTAELAADYKYQLRSYWLPTQAPYFLIISQDQGYLWQEPGPEDVQTLPSWQFPMQQVVAHYLPTLEQNDRLRGTELELITRQWLIDLSSGQPATAEVSKALKGSGFLESLQGTSIVAEQRWLSL